MVTVEMVEYNEKEHSKSKPRNQHNLKQLKMHAVTLPYSTNLPINKSSLFVNKTNTKGHKQ